MSRPQQPIAVELMIELISFKRSTPRNRVVSDSPTLIWLSDGVFKGENSIVDIGLVVARTVDGDCDSTGTNFSDEKSDKNGLYR